MDTIPSRAEEEGLAIPDRWFPADWGAAVWWSTGLAFVVLAVAVTQEFTTRVDTAVTHAAVAPRTAELTHVALVLNWFGSTTAVLVWAGSAAFTLDLHYRSSRRCRVRMVAVLLIDVAVVLAVKELGGRARPPSDLWLARVKTHSFPSGHATASTAAVSMLLICLAALSSSRRPRSWAVLAGMLVVAAIDASLVYLGVHYLSDVIGGTLLGCWLALSTAWIFDAVSRRRGRSVPPGG